MSLGHRSHQQSLDAVLDFLEPPRLPPDQSQAAISILHRLIDHYGPTQTSQKGYMPAALTQAVFDHVSAKDAFLIFFFSFMYENLCSRPVDAQDSDIAPYLRYFDDYASWGPDRLTSAKGAVEGFADYIVDNLLTPLRAASTKTPQPTPAFLSVSQTPLPPSSRQRMSDLRQNCLVRDHHRCVVSRKFHADEAEQRLKRDGDDCKDDDGNNLLNEPEDQFDFLEVAHILPHSLTSVTSDDKELSDSKQNALRILNMFDHGITHLIEYPKIDSPMNALTLTQGYHKLFGTFKLYFEHTGNPYQYKIISATNQKSFLKTSLLPVIRTLDLSPNRTIDPPSQRLLAVHRAIALIIKISGAAGYIEKIIRDMEEVAVRADGTTNLGPIINLRLGGWLNTLAVC